MCWVEFWGLRAFIVAKNQILLGRSTLYSLPGSPEIHRKHICIMSTHVHEHMYCMCMSAYLRRLRGGTARSLQARGLHTQLWYDAQL